MLEKDFTPKVRQVIEDFDFLACPKCGEGLFTDDDDGIDLLTMLGNDYLSCPFCCHQYHVSYYDLD